MLQEFRQFVMRGNVLDLAVGVIIGGAFGKIVSSLVNDIIMPLVSLLLAGKSFAGQFVSLNGQAYENLEAAQKAGAAVLAWGSFVQSMIDFLIVAFIIFLVVKAANTLRPPAPPPPAPGPSKEEVLLTEIRDELRKR